MHEITHEIAKWLGYGIAVFGGTAFLSMTLVALIPDYKGRRF